MTDFHEVYVSAMKSVILVYYFNAFFEWRCM